MTLKINRFALPAAFIIAYLINSVEFLRIISFLFSTIPLHEMGHALMAWMGGRWAVPLGAIVPTAGMTLIASSRSTIFIFIFFSFLSYGIYFFYRKKYNFHLNILLFIFFLSLYLTFRPEEMQLASFISFAGILGEILLSTFLIICFYYNLTERFRWDFWRFPVLFYGATGFTNTALQWYNIKKHLQTLPMGSAVSGEGARDMSGDLNQLILAGWSEAQITAVYWFFIKTCIILIILHYAIGLLKGDLELSKQIAD